MSCLLDNLVQFARLLRSAGLAVPGGGTIDAARAAQLVGMRRRDDLRFALRCVLVRRPEDLEVFDQAFRKFFGAPSGTATKLDLRPLGAERRFGDPSVEMESLRSDGGGSESRGERTPETVRIATYSDREVLREKDFKALTGEETEQAVRLLRDLKWRPAPRKTKRWTPGNGVAPDPRKLLANIARRPLVPDLPPTRQRKFAPRRLILLCDISGSMERYTRMLLWFACCLSGTLARVEVFLFATRLTRITHKVSGRRAANPMREIAEIVPDWSGGTRIGAAIRTFNVDWARRVLGQGAVLMIVSDGWDRGDPKVLEREVSRLQRSCHRLMWLSPLLGDPQYRPLTRGLQAALPYVDDFLPVHNLASIERLAERLNTLVVPVADRNRRPARGRRGFC